MSDDADVARCYPVFRCLRPHLEESNFVEQVKRQFSEGYRVAAVVEDGQVKSVAGFRILEFLAWGKVLYIDDLATLPDQKRRGFGGQLLDWIIAHARSEACNQVHLDSGYQRNDAHRLYLNKGFVLACHHFGLVLS